MDMVLILPRTVVACGIAAATVSGGCGLLVVILEKDWVASLSRWSMNMDQSIRMVGLISMMFV